MAIGLFTDQVIDHFSNPRNAGELANANGVGLAGDPDCGDIMQLFIRVEDDIIKDASFKIRGCVAALASASVTTILIKGKTIDEALQITNFDIAAALGGLPEQKMHCSVLGEQAIRKAVADYRHNCA
ncbi:MAG: iron-sulfur cluster assembly scaffold protein [Clostridia bacterium]|nr:iron-sulfur cluster assembly scaffold protein [Clostridia bacterium]